MFGRKKKEKVTEKNEMADPYPPYDPENPPCRCSFRVERMEILNDNECVVLKYGQLMGKARIGTIKIIQRCQLCHKTRVRFDFNTPIHVEIDK